MAHLHGVRSLTKEEVDQQMRDWKIENEERLEDMNEDDRFDAIEEKRARLEDGLVEAFPRTEREELREQMKLSGHKQSDFI